LVAGVTLLQAGFTAWQPSWIYTLLHAGHTNGKVGKINKYKVPLPLGLESQSAGACKFAHNIQGGSDKSQPPQMCPLPNGQETVT